VTSSKGLTREEKFQRKMGLKHNEDVQYLIKNDCVLSKCESCYR